MFQLKNLLLSAFSLTFFTLFAQSSDSIFSKRIRKLHVGGSFFSTPIKTNSNLIVVASHNKKMYFFDRSANILNTYKTTGWLHATPTQLSDGYINIGSYNGFLYFFDEEGNFNKKITPKGFIFTNSVELGSNIIFGCNKRLVFYDRQTGDISYLRLKRLVHGSPMITSDSLIVVGTNGKRLYFVNSSKEIINIFHTKGWIMHSKPHETFDGTIIFGSYDRHLYAVDKLGTLLWKYKTKGKIHASPIQTPDSTIIFGSFDGNIYVLSANGLLINSIQTGKRIISSPAMVNDSIVVIGSYDKHLYYITTKGKFIAKYNAQGKIFSSPVALSCGTVFCCTSNGILSFIPLECVIPEKIQNEDFVEIQI